MATLYEKLIAAGLPVISATEGGAISSNAMTDAQQVTFRNIIREHFDPAGYAEHATAKSAILTTAQSAVGIKLVDLTAAQIKALMACMLYAAGGVDLKTMTVKPLSEWVK